MLLWELLVLYQFVFIRLDLFLLNLSLFLRPADCYDNVDAEYKLQAKLSDLQAGISLDHIFLTLKDIFDALVEVEEEEARLNAE